jgi:rod shape-determining protein MreC
VAASFGDRVARRRSILFVVLLAVSVGLMAISSSGPAIELQRGVAFAFRPLQSGLDSFARGVTGLIATVTEIDTLHRTNEQLARENAQLSAENARTKELERQNELLTQLLEVKGSLGFSTVAGSVVGRESAQFRRVITADVGTDRGIKQGDVVVGAGGALVGRVTGTTGNSSTILLINDTASTVIGQLGANQATGSVVGQLGGVLIMENIDSNERIQIGDTVTTAGIDLGGGVRSPFPKGLIIGTIVDVARNANAVTQTAFIQPSVDLDRLEYVLVITDYQGGLPPVDQQPIPCASGGTLPEGEQPCVIATPTP